MPILTELQYRKATEGPWRIYVFDRSGFHRGGKYFRKGSPPTDHPEENHLWVTAEFAKDDAIRAIRQGLEVRITDGGDMLVFHAVKGRYVFPLDPQDFWDLAGV